MQLHRIAAGQIGATASIEEQRVAGAQMIVHEDALTPGRVTRGVDQLDRDVTDLHHVTAAVTHQLGVGEMGDLLDELRLGGLHMHGHRRQLEKILDSLDGVPHHLAAHMIGVVVGGDGSDKMHAIGGQHLEDSGHVVGGVDHNGLTGLAVSHEVHEVDHLLGQRVGAGDVATRQQLAEVQAVRGLNVSHVPILAALGQTSRMDQPAEHRSMVPATADLPEVLPTERLQASGMPVPALREQLRRIPNGRNVLNVLSVWFQTFGVLAVACILTPTLPLAAALGVWAVTFLLIGRGYSLLSILAHEAVHRCLFSRRRANDLVGRWLLAYPAFIPFDAYRRQHLAHHRDELGPDEPDLNLYRGYPITRASLLRKLRRDAFGSSGWKHLRGLVMAVVRRSSRPYAGSIVVTQAVLALAMTLLSGRWWLWPVMWLAPWLTVWRVLNRLRGIAEHGGMEHSPDRRRTTHVVHQSPAPRFWIVPFNTGWHLAHHTDMGVPFQNLPALHAELVASGWVTPAIEHPSYSSLWKTLGSG